MEPSCLHERKKAQLSLHTASRFAYIFLVRILYVRKRPLISKPTKKNTYAYKATSWYKIQTTSTAIRFCKWSTLFSFKFKLKIQDSKSQKKGYSTTRYYPTGSPSAFDSKKDYFFLT